ncbi:MAG: hypothetical protein SVO26_01320 [Chloroflexota bacterium]|nr:hypothetical protein [Chloroflexota bacterium]
MLRRYIILILCVTFLTLTPACSQPDSKVIPKPDLPIPSGDGSGQPEFELATDIPTVPETMMVYRAIPPDITVESVTELGRKFGFTGEAHSRFTPYEEEFWISDKETGASLIVNGNSGGIDYHSTRDLDSIFDAKNPSLPSYEEAAKIATDFLVEKGLLPADRYLKEVDCGGSRGDSQGNVVVTHLVVTFGRKIDGIPVTGGKFGVRIGDKGKVGKLLIMHREVEPYQEVPIKSSAEAFEDLKNRNVGEGVTQYILPVGCAKVVLDEMYLAYKVDIIHIKQEYVSPVYKFKGECFDEDGNSQGNFTGYVQAMK